MAVLFYCAGKVKFVEVEKELNKKQIGKRLLQVLIVLFGISFLTFGLTYLSPGDPAEIMLTECGNLPTPELLAKTRAELGLDKPFLVQYGNWLKGVVTGDMGTSYSFKVPVIDKLVSCFWPTLELALLSLAIMILVSVPLGILAAVHQNKWCDYMVRALTFLGVSIPSFWIGLILLRVFGVNLRWVSVSGGSTDFKSMIMPAITLAISMSAKYTRQVRIAVLDELRKDYVTGARMRGCTESQILWRHVLPQRHAAPGHAVGFVPGQPVGRHDGGGDDLQLARHGRYGGQGDLLPGLSPGAGLRAVDCPAIHVH